MSDTTTTEDPAAIERDIRQTQERMSRTVDRIGDQLSIKNVVNALLDKADQSNVDARMVLDGARRNPVALGLIAAGSIWLISDADARFPSLGRKDRQSEGTDSKPQSGPTDVHHRDYVSHMAAIQPDANEDAAAYQRRRDIARSNFFMVERGHEEDDRSFRQRLDDMTESFRRTRHDWADSAGKATASAQKSAGNALSGAQQAMGKAVTGAKQTARSAADSAQGLYSSNPLIGGVVAAALGAVVGLTLPLSETEQSALGDIGDKARDMVDDGTRQATEQLRDKKDELLDKADAALRPSDGTQSGGQGNQQGGVQSGTGAQSATVKSGDPFILAQ